MLKKFFFAVIALFFILFGGLFLLMGYVFNNPDKIFTAFTDITEKFVEGQPYEESAEFLLDGMADVKVTSQRADLAVRTYDGTSLKIVLKGKVPRFENGPFVLQTAEREVLNITIQEPLASSWVQLSINGQETTQESNSQLRAEIYIPESYKKELLFQTRRGSVEVRLPQQVFYELDLESTSGEIHNSLKQKPMPEVKPEDVGRVRVRTEMGSISVSEL